MNTLLVTTNPFGKSNIAPIKFTEDNLKFFDKVIYNNAGEKLTREQHMQLIVDTKPMAIIAGTELYDDKILDLAHKHLKIIARVGIGVDAVNLKACKERGIIVTNTPDAPSDAVAELTICQMINMLRKIQDVSSMMRDDKWNRYIGREIRECIIGIIGCGRIGSRVVDRLMAFRPKQIFINDVNSNCVDNLMEYIALNHLKAPKLVFADKRQIVEWCDIISIHIPLVQEGGGEISNRDYITSAELFEMKTDVRLLNMSRGGLINEEDLYNWLIKTKKATAAVDSFDNESYHGKLKSLRNAYLTPHLGSCTVKGRLDMELGAAQEIHRFIIDKPLLSRCV